MTSWFESLGRPKIAGAIIAIAMAFMARLALGYRSFPAVDDFVYVPIARAQFDPSLYPTDLFVQEFIFHTPVLAVLIHLLESTIGIANGLLIVTLGLSVATVLAMHRVMRCIGCDGVLLPLAVLIAACGTFNGLGRGQFEGIFGNAFHMQWVALCLLLWAYERFIRQHAVATGILLGLTAMMHPVVGAHGAAVLFFATFLSTTGRWRRLAVTAAVCLLVSSPSIIPLLLNLLRREISPAFDVVTDGYLFRTPGEFVLEPLMVAFFAVVVGLGWGGMILLLRRGLDPGIRAFAGVMFGQTVLACLAIAAHGTWAEDSWVEQVNLVYRVVLTRTTPLLLALSAIAFAAATERQMLGAMRLERAERSGAARIAYWACAGAALSIVSIQVTWHPILIIAVLLMIATCGLWQIAQLRAAAVGLWAVFGIASLGIHLLLIEVEAPVPAEEMELFAWARDSTPPEALFVVSPGFQGFRLYAERGAYVDFKTFPATTVALIPEWRRRLEHVAAPDRLGLDEWGWSGIVEWDRTYASRNTPARIADLLGETGTDYFIWDSEGLEMPPYTAVERVDDRRLRVAFSNARFTVYRLADVDDDQAS